MYLYKYYLIVVSHQRGHILLVQLAAHIFVLVSRHQLYNWPGLVVLLGLLVTQVIFGFGISIFYIYSIGKFVYVYYIVIIDSYIIFEKFSIKNKDPHTTKQ